VGKIDEKKLKKAQAAYNATAAYKVVYIALGLDDKFIRSVHASRKKK
jgi:hypothetical protein